MFDVVGQVNEAHRKLGTKRLPEGEARTLTLRRTYEAPVEDVWDALTNPDRIARWLLPVSGELHVGGTYQLEGNAGGEILRCEKPSLLAVTWAMPGMPGPSVSQVEVRLSDMDGPDGEPGKHTRFELEHAAVGVPQDMWDEMGPSAVGIGWDLSLLGLAAHLAGAEPGPGVTEEELLTSQEGKEFMTRCSTAWAAAHEADGASAEVAAAAAERTLAMYTGGPSAG